MSRIFWNQFIVLKEFEKVKRKHSFRLSCSHHLEETKSTLANYFRMLYVQGISQWVNRISKIILKSKKEKPQELYSDLAPILAHL